MLVVLTGVLTWQQFITAEWSNTHLQWLWFFREVFSSRINPGLHCNGQMAGGVYAVMWASGLPMPTQCPMMKLDLWHGQAQAMDNEYGCILWIREPEDHCRIIHQLPTPYVAAWQCYKDRLTIPGSWKHPSSWMSQIFSSSGCSGSTRKAACSSSYQYPATSHNHWRGGGQHSTGHDQPDPSLKLCSD